MINMMIVNIMVIHPNFRHFSDIEKEKIGVASENLLLAEKKVFKS